MRRSGLLALTLLSVACGTKSACATQPDWQDTLATVFSAQTVLTDFNVAGEMAPVIRFSNAPCRTAQMPEYASGMPVVASIVTYQDDTACSRNTQLVLLQVSLSTSANQQDRLREALSRLLPAACFNGDLPNDPRRHAPVRHLLVWITPARIVTLGTEAGDGTTIALSLLQVRRSTVETESATRVSSTFVSGLPKSCR